MPVNRTYLPKEEILSLKPFTNYVLVKIDDPNEYRKTEGGIYLYVDQDVDTAMHANRHGTVVSVCKKLHYVNRSRKETFQGKDVNVGVDSVEYDSDIDVVKGDRVFFSYLDGLNCNEFVESEFSIHNEVKIHFSYKLLRYDSLRVCWRGDEVMGLNGYYLIEPTEETTSKLILLQKKNPLVSMGIVRAVSKPNRIRLTPGNKEIPEGVVKVGDKVAIRSKYLNWFEDSLHKKFDKPLRIINSSDIFGVL